MQTVSNCPICQQRNWQSLAQRTFSRSQCDFQSTDYVAKRLRVLFDVWFPDSSEVVLTSSLCRECGFITNLPRVEETDIDAKYRYLEKLGQDYGSSEKSEVEVARAKRLWQHVSPFLKSPGEVLDFGGGDGRLMREFIAGGNQCYLVDYNRSPREKITKLADTLEGIDSNRCFDAIICNHVIEHVAEPVATLRGLARHLKPQATLMVEVPMEIWGKPPLMSDPVTHVNFFSVGSLRRAFEMAGLSLLRSAMIGYVHPSGRIHAAVLCIGKQRSASEAVGSSSGFREVQRYLRPGLVDRLLRKWRVR